MLAGASRADGSDERLASTSPKPTRPSARSRRLQSLIAFSGGAGLVLAYALRGGSYDIVSFEEYGLVIWWVLAIGIAVGLLPRARPRRVVLLLLGLILAYAAWTALSLSWTESSELTTEELARSMGYLGLVALLVSALDRNTWRAAAAGIGFGALLVCAVALASRLLPSDFPVDYAAVAFGRDRLSYPLGYWNALAAWGAMSTAIGLAWSAHDPGRVRRAVALGLVPVACLTTYLTYSRAGVAGTALAAITVVAFSRNRLTAIVHSAVAAGGAALAIVAVRGAPAIAHATGNRGAPAVVGGVVFATALCAAVGALTGTTHLDRRRIPRTAVRSLAALCLIVVLLSGAIFGPTVVSSAWHSFTHSAGSVSNDPAARFGSLGGSRYQIWKVALKAFDRSPVAGTGAGTFEFWWNRHGTDPEFLRDSHSLWFENLGELGAPGLLLIAGASVAAVALGIAVLRRSRRSASAGAGVAFLAAFLVYLVHASVDWMWESTAVTMLALGGVGVIGARLCGDAPRLRWYFRATLVVLALVGGAVQIPGLLSTTEIRRSQAAARAGNTALALAWANDAVTAEPWSASAYEQRGLVLESEGRLTQAAEDLHRAISHERTNFAHWLVLARVETERGGLDAAVHDFLQAHSLRPRSLLLYIGPYSTTH